MTLNCPVNQAGQPLGLPQEVFILYRPSVEFEIAIDGLGKKNAKGTAYLTNYRIIFVNSKPNQEFFSFDIPIRTLFKEDVAFPFFGSTYLHGSTPPYQNLLPGPCHFKLYFKNGGCDTFIRSLSVLIKETRKQSSKVQHELSQAQFYQKLNTGNINFNAYADPSDPSVIYTHQPNH